MKRNIVFLAVISFLVTASVFGQKAKVPAKPAQPAQTKIPRLFDQNLIKNGNAESGNGAPWTNANELKTLIYGEFGGGPTATSEGPGDRGEKYFYVRTTTDAPIAIFTEKVDVSAVAAAIDKGEVTYGFGGWFGVANGSSSAGRLKILFLDAAGKSLKQDMTGEINEENRPADEVLTEKSGSGNLPVGTRKVEITLEFKIFGGHEEKQDNLAFADNMWMTLAEKKK